MWLKVLQAPREPYVEELESDHMGGNRESKASVTGLSIVGMTGVREAGFDF